MSSLDAPRSLLFSELTQFNRGYGAVPTSGNVLPTTTRSTMFGTGESKLPPTKSASRRQRHVRTLNVRERLNLPPEESTEDGSIQDQARNVMAAYCNVEEYDTQQLVQALPGRAVLIGDVATVASPTNIELAQNNPNGPPIAFFFPYGCAVLWGFTESETQDLLSLAETFANGVLPEIERSFDCMGFEKATVASSDAKRGRSKRFMERHHSLDEESEGGGRERGSGGGGGSPRNNKNGYTSDGIYSDDGRGERKGKAGAISDSGFHSGKEDDDYEDRVRPPPPPPSLNLLEDSPKGSTNYYKNRNLNQKSNMDYIVDHIPPIEEKEKKVCVAHFRTNSAGIFTLSDTMDPLAKLSVSYAFAQSGKLETLENGVDVLVEDLRPIPEQLANTGRCNFSGRDVARATGRTFLLSSTANLYSDILDEPDFFWEEDAYLPIYARASAYLDNEQRTKILNSRIDVIQKLLESLNDQLTTEHGHHLEVIVIILIVVEVVLDIMRWGDLF